MFTSNNLIQLWKITIFHRKIEVNHLTGARLPWLNYQVEYSYSQKITQRKPAASNVGATADQDLNEDFTSKPQGNWVFLEGRQELKMKLSRSLKLETLFNNFFCNCLTYFQTYLTYFDKKIVETFKRSFENNFLRNER